METLININDLMAIGFTPGRSLGMAVKLAEKMNLLSKDEMLVYLKNILNQPENFLDDEVYADLASTLIEEAKLSEDDTIALKEVGAEYIIYGADNIEVGAKMQMAVAMKLPVTVAGALMPDAHPGYGLPIGGVLATKNAIIPYGVGVDIGCRMALSIYDLPVTHFFENESKYKRELIAQTKFGAGHGFQGQYKADHEVLDSGVFNSIGIVRDLKDKASSQLGSSGGGNHFVEFGIIEFKENDESLGIEKGNYLALLSHSGSRGLGATIAGHYTKLAKQICKLPQEAANLAYLDLNTEAGQEYWLAMNLAGDYASACHEIIHAKIAKALGASVLAKVENHHNFAWKEMWFGQEVIVHRKGATPAGKGVMGIIPGSMTAPGFLVRGKGVEQSIKSASHGAGRQMSRTKANKEISKQAMKAVLKEHGVTLIGAGKDEAPMVYKNIHTVMAAQNELVDIVATFTPKMVRMADDGSRED
jgi:tRNA-splicing ligase RtcB (3'-phosphate/5'-hydroxy nucleic acid ligase)